jgi:hypothetical protein
MITSAIYSSRATTFASNNMGRQTENKKAGIDSRLLHRGKDLTFYVMLSICLAMENCKNMIRHEKVIALH